MGDKIECHWFKPSKHDVIHLGRFKFRTSFKINQPPKWLRQLKIKCEKCTMECIQNEKRSEQTELEI